MKYWFYHELIYQVAKKLADFHIKQSNKCIYIMRKMADRLKASDKMMLL